MRLAFAALALAACADPSPGAPDAAAGSSPFDAAFVDHVGQSGWVFRARVVEVGATLEPLVTDVSHAIVVEIEQSSLEPLEAPLPAGTRDTVILTGPATDFAVGDEAYFLVGWQYAGETWTFTEVGRLDGALDFATVHEAVHLAHRYWLDRALADRLAGSERVVDAVVTAVEQLPGGGSDSGPEWWQATLSPWHTLRGTVSIDPVTVRFDGAANICCYQWPHLAVGDRAIYLLQRDGDLVLDGPLDRQDLHDIERVRSLLASPPASPF